MTQRYIEVSNQNYYSSSSPMGCKSTIRPVDVIRVDRTLDEKRTVIVMVNGDEIPVGMTRDEVVKLIGWE